MKLIIIIVVILAVGGICLIPVNRVCGIQGAACASAPLRRGGPACYFVARKPFIADLLNVKFYYSTSNTC